jgi:arylamine N-acetyltransferase
VSGPDWAAAYLARLGLDAEPPSAEALARLHRAHVERIPYETLWIPLGERWDVDPVRAAERIAFDGRGGYCFHLNGAFAELLAALGYHVSRHVGGVHGPGGPSVAELTNHLVLSVAGLPSAGNATGTWYVDVGLGDALHDPLPLHPGRYVQPPWSLTVARTPGGVGDWHLVHGDGGGFTGMAWRSAPAATAEFAARHEWLSTSPESGFVKLPVVQTRDATGVDVLRGLVLRRIGAAATEATLTSRAELLDVLQTMFGIDVDAIGRARLGALWDRLHAAHLAWDAAGRP